jgi:hypothetical protein
MLSYVVAELFLCLFTDADRATSIVGDLQEQAQERNSLWFWMQVLRTAAVLFAHNVAAAPLQLGVLVVFGCLFELTCTWIGGFLMRAWVNAANATPSHPAILLPLADFGIWVWQSGHPLLVGILVARLARGRELTVCVAVAVAMALVDVFFVASFFWWNQALLRQTPWRVVTNSADSAIWLTGVLVFAGALVRGKRLARNQPQLSAH